MSNADLVSSFVAAFDITGAKVLSAKTGYLNRTYGPLLTDIDIVVSPISSDYT